jgi:PAS domain S-box-containing protein
LTQLGSGLNPIMGWMLRKHLAFCAHAINKPDEVLIVPDSREDAHFSDNPLVTGDPHVIFYVGVPLNTSNDHSLGTLCVIDNQPNSLSVNQIESLKALSQQVVKLIELGRANNKLVEREHFYTTVIESALAGYWDWNLKENTKIYSPRFKEMFGYGPDELEDLPKVFEQFEKPVASKGEVRYEGVVRYLHKNGTLVWAKYSGQVIEWDENDQPIRVVGSHVDLTNQRMIQEKLELALESTGTGVWEWDILTNSLIWDKGMYDLYGITETTFSGTYEAWTNGVHLEDQEASQNLVNLAIEGKAIFDTVFRVVWPARTVRYLHGQGRVFRNEKGGPIKMIGLNYDIKDLRIAEEKLALALKSAGTGVWD